MTTATAFIAAHSKHWETGTELITAVATYPRIVHAEFMTHRMISKNSSSSRAIPGNSVIETLENEMFVPEYWGKNQSGMQAKETLDAEAEEIAREIWIRAGRNMIEAMRELGAIGLHKQLQNRVSEAFQPIRVCMSATEWNNLHHLRDHADAQPEIQDLSKALKTATNNSEPIKLYPGDWHLPFFKGECGNGVWLKDADELYPMEDARMISMSCAAQTSYRKNDDTLEKAKRLFSVFFDTTHIHASPAEHQATALDLARLEWGGMPDWDALFAGKNAGATHVDKYGDVWSGNFKHFAQFRQLIPNHNKRG